MTKRTERVAAALARIASLAARAYATRCFAIDNLDVHCGMVGKILVVLYPRIRRFGCRSERAFAIMLVQPIAMVLRSGSDFGLLPLGLILFAILALPVFAAAKVAASFRARGRAQD